MKNMFTLWFIWGFTACTSSIPPSYIEEGTTPRCLKSEDQQGYWERMGDVLYFSEGIPVAPSLLVFNNELWLYYSLREELHDTVYLTQSSNGIDWSEPVLVTGFDDETEIKHFNVTSSEEGFRAFLGGGTITDLYSSDGIQWTIQAQQIVPSEDFDQWGQLYPTFDVASERIWFSGFNGTSYSIGLADYNGQNWINEGPILQADEDLRYENTAVAQSSVMSTEEGFRLWYGGYDTSQTDPGPWRILTAISSDGINWERQGLALDLMDSGEEAYGVREPSVVLWQDHLWMAYISMGDDFQYRLRIAQCL